MCRPTKSKLVHADSSDTNTTASTAPLPPADVDEIYDVDVPIVYTDEELDAMKQVKKLLDEYQETKKQSGGDGDDDDYSRVGLKYIAMTTIISKNRPDEAFDKIQKFLKALKEVELTSNVLSDEELSGDDSTNPLLNGSNTYFNAYHTCGLDNYNRDSMWIRGDNDRVYLTIDEQQNVIKAGILYHMAIHSNPNTLRNGLAHFVIDITDKPTYTTSKDVSKVESKLQKINQSFPLRPQSILIVGATGIKRVVVNTLIKVASIFTKIKILQRIKFTSIEEAIKLFHYGNGVGGGDGDVDSDNKQSQQPLHYGGNGLNGIDQSSIPMWVKQRIESFPIPEL